MLLAAFLPSGLFAQTATTSDVLKQKIDERNAQIQQLETEIDQYNLEVTNAQSEAKTLQGALNTLDLTKKKITTDITLTQSKISKASLTIEELDQDIGSTSDNITLNHKVLAEAMRNMQIAENSGIIETILSAGSISDLWTDIDNVRAIQETIRGKTRELSDLKTNMESQQKSLGEQKSSLVSLQKDLSSKQEAVESTAKEKSDLLAQTKNKEQTYQALLTTKEQERAQFEQEVADFEAQLNLTVDKSAYPAPKHGIISWPLDNAPTGACDTAHKILSCIVRGFSHPTVVNGVTTDPGHNGVDFRASTGTKVKSVLDGVVAGTGNTDIYKGCYGLGKWVMVNHPNGLSSIYMHLSVISVSTGQELKTGDLIGLSGNTGNSEAPHLHVTIYATQGVRIEQFVNSIGCKQAVVPLADPKAYLDPMSYFPNV
jgi:murein DD-endopeptidase MepM/ murein hydrolase activator NlpD